VMLRASRIRSSGVLTRLTHIHVFCQGRSRGHVIPSRTVKGMLSLIPRADAFGTSRLVLIAAAFFANEDEISGQISENRHLSEYALYPIAASLSKALI
jgi:hypothetical protein